MATDADTIYVITATDTGSGEEGPPGEAIKIFGRGRHNADPVDRSRMVERFGTYVSLAGDLVTRANKATDHFVVDEITFHLGVSTEVGLAFVGQAGVDAGIDVTLKRQP